MWIIGITGTIGAGKGTVVDYLVKNMGFQHFSVRDFLVEKLKENGGDIDRDRMTELANRLRRENGNSFIVDELYKKARALGKNAVIESIRAVDEIESLKSKGNFYLLAVDADARLRYQRILLRNSETDHVDFETFLANEAREMNNSDPSMQNLQACMQRADILLNNDGDIPSLYLQVKEALESLQNRTRRPGWDEYFMALCAAVAKRATCDRGKSGCVIVKDKQILVTGYVGSPSHLPHCDEVGHLFKKTLHDDGTITNHCVRTVHAEQNAICQAARRGIALEGATLYCTMTPCRTCAMLIINCGIKRVVCNYKYHAGAESEEMLAAAHIQLDYFHEEILSYNRQK